MPKRRWRSSILGGSPRRLRVAEPPAAAEENAPAAEMPAVQLPIEEVPSSDDESDVDPT